MEQTSLCIVSAIRSTTLSSFDCGLPRPAMTSWSPVRISRADAAALSGMTKRYQMEPRPVTQDDFRSVPEETPGEELVGPDGQLRAAADAELLEDGVQVDLDRPLGNSELLRDFAIAQAFTHETDQLAFAGR